jgi:hypothetical protein
MGAEGKAWTQQWDWMEPRLALSPPDVCQAAASDSMLYSDLVDRSLCWEIWKDPEHVDEALCTDCFTHSLYYGICPQVFLPITWEFVRDRSTPLTPVDSIRVCMCSDDTWRQWRLRQWSQQAFPYLNLHPMSSWVQILAPALTIPWVNYETSVTWAKLYKCSGPQFLY